MSLFNRTAVITIRLNEVTHSVNVRTDDVLAFEDQVALAVLMSSAAKQAYEIFMAKKNDQSATNDDDDDNSDSDYEHISSSATSSSDSDDGDVSKSYEYDTDDDDDDDDDDEMPKIMSSPVRKIACQKAILDNIQSIKPKYRCTNKRHRCNDE